jgi:glycosyltransferase involved in cell wall biosynthesis
MMQTGSRSAGIRRLNVHIYPSYFTHESRILRIVETLRTRRIFDEFLIIAIRRPDLPEDEELAPGVRLVRLGPAFGQLMRGRMGRLVKALGWYVAVLRRLRTLPVVCINCHSLSVLPIGVMLRLGSRCRLVYDTHELETETVPSRGVRRQLARLAERLLIGRCDAVSVVNGSIARWYRARYRLPTVWVVRNMPRSSGGVLRPTGLLRRAIALEARPECLIYLYQGLLTNGRGVRMLLEVFARMGEPRHLVLMGYGDLEPLVRRAAATHSNIHFVPAVPPDRVLEYTADADVGLAMVENVCLSYYYSLPNKVFEYAMCGVPSLVSDFPEMARFVDESGFGWKVQPEARAIAAWLSALERDEIERKKELIRSSGARYGWETEEAQLLDMYAHLGMATAGSSAGAPG